MKIVEVFKIDAFENDMYKQFFFKKLTIKKKHRSS